MSMQYEHTSFLFFFEANIDRFLEFTGGSTLTEDIVSIVPLLQADRFFPVVN